MEALNTETLVWARKVGLSPERVAFLLACPKFTVCKGHRKSERVVTDNPNHHLQRLGDAWWFRLRRRGTDIVENIGPDITVARQLIWEGRVTLNSVYSLVAVLNYDALAGQTTYESIGLVQRIANSWELEYGVMQRLDPLNSGKNSLGFQLRARLFKF